MKLYKVVNFQHDTVKVFQSLENAKAHVDSLRLQFPDEGFYVVELLVVYWQGKIN